MGTAFSSSLFGLAGSLLLGLLALFAGQAQNRFLQQLEDWLSVYTRLVGLAPDPLQAEDPVSYNIALLAHAATNLEEGTRLLASSTAERQKQIQVTADLTVNLQRLAETLEAQQTTQHRTLRTALDRLSAQLASFAEETATTQENTRAWSSKK